MLSFFDLQKTDRLVILQKTSTQYFGKNEQRDERLADANHEHMSNEPTSTKNIKTIHLTL